LVDLLSPRPNKLAVKSKFVKPILAQKSFAGLLLQSRRISSIGKEEEEVKRRGGGGES
jgi:hypothetical protein